MKEIPGQITLDDFLEQEKQIFPNCTNCICFSCLYREDRCPYGRCYDDLRAKENPYNEAHPGEAPRKSWSNWGKPGEQAHWCRGGIAYPVRWCEKFVKYMGSRVEECVGCNIVIFQDGYISCQTKERIGCEACIERAGGMEPGDGFSCPHMTDTGCGQMITAKNRILKAAAEGEDIELCKEQCCIGCVKNCRYRCGQG